MIGAPTLPTGGCTNGTLTFVALSLRSADQDFRGDVSRTLGVLISGRGSNLKAIIDAIARATARCVDRHRHLEPRRCAGPRSRASRQASRRWCSSHKAYPSREDYDRALVAELQQRDVALVCLAGFMRLLSPVFVDAYPNRILNIHPSLLPKYPGPASAATGAGRRRDGQRRHCSFREQGPRCGADRDAERACRSFPAIPPRR